ncbi:DUF3048 domain-containing protein [Patescibacteria group bacterium]|nr:DUF3048 domain-containing protein [Patescibacteria group bacterium]
MTASSKKGVVFYLLGGLGIYLVSAGISFAAFRYLGSGTDFISPLPADEGRSQIDLSAPKTEACPLTGQMFTKAERAIWESRRPLGIMVENHVESRPQSGLTKADVVYEAVAEGGITRFLTIYLCQASAEDVLVGPVRSARTYFLDWISEYGDSPLYAHVGGANTPGKANALGQIGDYGWLRVGNDLNQFAVGFPTFWRDYERLTGVATEHTMYSTVDKLLAVAEKRDLAQVNEDGDRWDEEFVSWDFVEEGQSSESGEVHSISFNFWGSQTAFKVDWEFNSASGVYERSMGEQRHVDLNNGQPVVAKVVVVQFVRETGPIDDLKHMLYGTTGSGTALVFQNGEAIKASWSKKTRTDRTLFTDSTGETVAFERGPIWMEMVPAGNTIDY